MYRLRVKFYRKGVRGRNHVVLKNQGRIIRPSGLEDGKLVMQAVYSALALSMLEVHVYLDRKKPKQPYEPVLAYSQLGFHEKIQQYDFPEASEFAEL